MWTSFTMRSSLLISGEGLYIPCPYRAQYAYVTQGELGEESWSFKASTSFCWQIIVRHCMRLCMPDSDCDVRCTWVG